MSEVGCVEIQYGLPLGLEPPQEPGKLAFVGQEFRESPKELWGGHTFLLERGEVACGHPRVCRVGVPKATSIRLGCKGCCR